MSGVWFCESSGSSCVWRKGSIQRRAGSDEGSGFQGRGLYGRAKPCGWRTERQNESCLGAGAKDRPGYLGAAAGNWKSIGSGDRRDTLFGTGGVHPGKTESGRFFGEKGSRGFLYSGPATAAFSQAFVFRTAGEPGQNRDSEKRDWDKRTAASPQTGLKCPAAAAGRTKTGNFRQEGDASAAAGGPEGTDRFLAGTDPGEGGKAGV